MIILKNELEKIVKKKFTDLNVILTDKSISLNIQYKNSCTKVYNINTLRMSLILTRKMRKILIKEFKHKFSTNIENIRKSKELHIKMNELDNEMATVIKNDNRVISHSYSPHFIFEESNYIFTVSPTNIQELTIKNLMKFQDSLEFENYEKFLETAYVVYANFKRLKAEKEKINEELKNIIFQNNC